MVLAEERKHESTEEAQSRGRFGKQCQGPRLILGITCSLLRVFSNFLMLKITDLQPVGCSPLFLALLPSQPPPPALLLPSKKILPKVPTKQAKQMGEQRGPAPHGVWGGNQELLPLGDCPF